MQQTQSILQTRSRDYWYDNIKGVLMIMVVVGHLLGNMRTVYPSMRFVYDFINMFHMVAFMIVSGYLSKRRIDQKDYIGVIDKNVIPYLPAQTLIYAFAALLPHGLWAASATNFFSKYDFDFFVPIYQLWYLGAMIIYVLICAKLQPKRHPVLFMIGAILAALACGYLRQVAVFKLSKIVSHFPFFLLGYLLPEKPMKFIRNKRWLCIPALAVFAVFIWFVSNGEWCRGINELYTLSDTYATFGKIYPEFPALLARFLFLTLAPLVAFAFFALMPRKKNLLSKLGQHSMAIYVLHAFVIIFLRCADKKYGLVEHIDTWWLQLLWILLGVGLTFLLGTDWVTKVFRPILQPNVSIVTIAGTLMEKYQQQKAVKEAAEVAKEPATEIVAEPPATPASDEKTKE